MLRDMTIGQFYPAESVIHRLDPRVKVVGVLAYLISLFLFRGWICCCYRISRNGDCTFQSPAPLHCTRYEADSVSAYCDGIV